MLFISFSMFIIICVTMYLFLFFFSSRRRHTRLVSDWSSDVCSSDLTFSACSVHTNRRQSRAVLERQYVGRQVLQAAHGATGAKRSVRRGPASRSLKNGGSGTLFPQVLHICGNSTGFSFSTMTTATQVGREAANSWETFLDHVK